MITRAPNCEDDSDPQSLGVDEALARILEHVPVLEGFERLHLRSALGRFLAEDIDSPVDVPQHTNSAMDGYAIAATSIPSSGTRTLTVIGSAFAGRPYTGEVSAETAVRIMTGAAMPEGTDTVLMQEHVKIEGDQVTFDGDHKYGQNVRAAGEDLKSGQRVLSRGHRIGASELGLIASLGIGEVSVYRRVRVAYFSTGDELRSLGESLGRGEIYDSNRYTLYAMLTRAGCEVIDMGVVRDRREDVEAALQRAAAVADVVITSGGVSVGEADYIKEVLAAIGEVRFWKVAMKPGRPLAFGTIGDARFFGLPGNPVSVMVTFQQFVLPALRRMGGGAAADALLQVEATAAAKVRKRPGRMEYQRGILSQDDAGRLTVVPTGDQGSGILNSMSRADCYIVLPVESGNVERGAPVLVQPFIDRF